MESECGRQVRRRRRRPTPARCRRATRGCGVRRVKAPESTSGERRERRVHRARCQPRVGVEAFRGARCQPRVGGEAFRGARWRAEE
eukprot:7048091-Prymnesium_polylepis.1